jgi:hypothetical protein
MQRLVDRLDPESVPVSVDEAQYFGGRGSSSLGKKAEGIQDFIGSPQLSVLLLQFGDARLVLGRNPGRWPLSTSRSIFLWAGSVSQQSVRPN